MIRIGLLSCAVATLLVLEPLAGSGAERQATGHGGRSNQPVLGTPTEAGLEEEFRRLREALRASPEYAAPDAPTHVRLAEALAHRGDVNGAKAEYRAAIRLQPDLARAYRGLGQVLLDHHEYAEAVQALQQCVRLDKPDGETMYWLGRAHMGVANLSEAEAALGQAARLRPDDPEMFAGLGLVRMARGQLEAAGQALDQALALRPDGADVHHLREVLRTYEGDPSAVQREAQAMLRGIFARE